MQTNPIPFFQRLTVRVAAAVFVLLFLVDVVTTPFWTWLTYTLSPEWSDPVYIRNYLEILESPPEQRAALWANFDDGFERSDRIVIYSVILAYSFVFAAIISPVVSRIATRRIRRLASQIESPSGEATLLSGPFDVGGADEIRALADTMNQMREHISALVGELRERDRQRMEWVSGISHDLRAPLTALSASVTRSRGQLAHISDPRPRQSLERLLRAAQLDIRRLSDLAGHLLEIARLETGNEIVIEPVPVGQLLRNAVDGLQPLAEDRGIALDLNYPTGLPQLSADGRQLIRAVENIIVNALQHAERGVTVEARLDGGLLHIRITDDGAGLPLVNGAVALEALGQNPRRADSTGLGLEVARRIMAAHDGELVGENLLEGGARVTLVLPVP